MSLDQHIYGSTDWHLPSPSSTPKSVTFLDSSFKTPRTDVVPQSHFIDAWSTPRVNGHQTPAQTPSFTVFTPVDRRSSSYSQTTRSPEDPGFHVNHFTSSNLPLPPVEPARRLSSSPRPLSATGTEVNMNNYPAGRGRPLSINISQMQTPPPTRDATSRRSMPQHAGNDSATPATPATVIQRTPTQLQASDAFFNQTPFGFQPLQFSPDMVQFPSTAPMSAPPLPHSRLFWDQLNNSSGMDVDMALMSDPFGPTPHRIDGNVNWQTFHTPANQMNPQAFQALHGVSSPDPVSSLVAQAIGAGEPSRSRPNSFIATSEGVDPSMLFSFSSPGPTASFSNHTQSFHNNNVNRQPYETQARVARETLRDRELAKKANGQHSRTNTSSSTASFEVRPGLQRSNTDSGLRKSRPSSIDSKSSGSAAGFNIPRHSSPLKRQSGGSLTAIPEARRARTRLVIDEDGRARTETVPAEDDVQLRRDSSRDSQRDLRQQYPGLYEDDDSETESDEAPVTLSRNSSFNLPPQRRSSKHARQDSDGLERGNSFKVARPSSGIFDKSSFETIRPVKRTADNPFRRFSMMDFSTSFNDTKESEDQYMPDSPGDALGALKKVVVEGRQKRIERATQNTLMAHNQRWAQASADINTNPNGLHDSYSFQASPSDNTDASLNTPSTDRSSLSGEGTRCLCNGIDDGQPMIQCESCNKWLHMGCVGLTAQNLPPVYVCIFCTGQTPIARGGRVRGPIPPFDSPLTHKSVFRR